MAGSGGPFKLLLQKKRYARRRRHPAPRDRAGALPQLRPLRHHEPRAARHARRPQAGPAAHPLRHVRPTSGSTPDSRFRKSATVVGEVMGKYHPHGDTAIYDAMVRMAQHFCAPRPARGRPGQLRLARRRQPGGHALHRGQADAARRDVLRRRSASRHRPLPPELRRHALRARRPPGASPRTSSSTARPASRSGWRRTSRRTTSARSSTRRSTLIKQPERRRLDTLVENYVQGPDFPTGGRILNTPEELAKIYETGEGAVDLRGEYETGRARASVIITSIPYALTKGDLIEKIADHIRAREGPADRRHPRREHGRRADRAGDQARRRAPRPRWPTSSSTPRSRPASTST